MTERPRGFVLIVVLGIIGALAVLALSFASSSQIERQISRGYVDRLRAKLLAQAGVEKAIGYLRNNDLRKAWSDPRDPWYYGEMREQGLHNTASSYRASTKITGNSVTTAGQPPRGLSSAPYAQEVSFLEGTVTIQGQKLPYSGALPGTYRENGDLFVLKILDSASQILVNDPQHNLEKMLNRLGELLGVNEPFGGKDFLLGEVLVRRAADRGRPYQHKREILEALLSELKDREEATKRFGRIKDFVSCHGWIDPTTVWWDPTGQGPAGGSMALSSVSPPEPGIAPSPVEGGPGRIVGTEKLPGRGGHTTPSKLGSLHYWIEPRAPVNVNTASREVLITTLWGLAATYEEYDTDKGLLRTVDAEIDLGEAAKLADWIIQNRYKFGEGQPGGPYSYNDWMHFYIGNEDGTGLDDAPFSNELDRMLVKVAMNPNSNIRKLNPDLIQVNPNPAALASSPLSAPARVEKFLHMDRSDLVSFNTEWCFNSGGHYEIESVGRVYDGEELVAEESIWTVLKLFDTWRATSQEDFERYREFYSPGNGKPLLTQPEGYPGVVTLPEYPYNYKTVPTRYKAADSDISLATAWAADWDGQLISNGMVRVQAGVNTGKRSFVAGFSQGHIGPDQWLHENFHDPRHPEHDIQSFNCRGTIEKVYPLHSHLQDTDYTAGHDALHGDGHPLHQAKKPFILEPFGSYQDLWIHGYDLHPFGVYFNQVKRKRFHSFWADELPAPEGTVEFFVKPEVDIWQWAKQSPNCRRMHLFDWGPARDDASNYTIRIFVEGSRVHLNMQHRHPGGTGGTTHHLRLYKDVNWYNHSWHHIEASWAPKGSVSPDGVLFEYPSAMLFVDGAPADGVMGDVAPEDVVQSPVLHIKLHEDVKPIAPSTVSSVERNPKITLGGRIGGSSYGHLSCDFVGTIDNLIMHHWRLHHRAFPPKSRYFDPSYTNEPGYVLPVQNLVHGVKKANKCIAGIYVRRLPEIESLAKEEALQIGTVSVTHYHASHKHTLGHKTAQCSGHINVGLSYRVGGSYQEDELPYDGGVGVSYVNYPPIQKGNQLYFRAEFELRNELPLNYSPILDDITITTFGRPKLFTYASGSGL